MSPVSTARRPQRPRTVSRADARLAKKLGHEQRVRQAKSLKRAIPASRDVNLTDTGVSTRLVRKGAKVIDRDPTLVGWLGDLVEAAHKGKGRPGALSLRTALICFWLLSVSGRNFQIINLPPLLAGLSWRVRRQLGIDYLDRRGRPHQLNYEQLLRTFNSIADVLDPFQEGLSEEASTERAIWLQELSTRLVRASVDNLSHNGNLAVDATLVWAWNRPPRTHGEKIERLGRDGDAGRAIPLSAVVASDDDELDDAPFVEDAMEEVRANSGRRRSWPSTWSDGARWVGRGNPKKSVYGYACHTLVPTDRSVAPVIEALAVTPAPALPARAVMPLLRATHDARLELEGVKSGSLPALGEVVADGVYSANTTEWQIPIRRLGGAAIFRLHRNNQAGRREVRGHTFVDGRPHCSCIPNEIARVPYPGFPYKRATMSHYQEAVARRRSFEMRPNGNFRANGSRQFFTPHFNTNEGTGGCGHCVDAYGNAVVDPETGQAKPRCCSQRTLMFDELELGLYQLEAFGTEEWYQRWNPRSRVEGSYGVLKNLSLVNWGHSYHHFVGLARETLVMIFAAMAHNFHVQRTHAAKQAS